MISAVSKTPAWLSPQGTTPPNSETAGPRRKSAQQNPSNKI